MSEAAYVAVDWGTSGFRGWLVDSAGRVLAERRSHEGMMAAAKLGGFASVLRSHLDTIGAAGSLPVVVCGMAGACQGWVEAGYVDTPAPPVIYSGARHPGSGYVSRHPHPSGHRTA